MGIAFIACDLDRATRFRTDNQERMICRDENNESAWVVLENTNQLLASFDYSLLDASILMQFFGAGFFIVATFEILGIVLSKIIEPLK